jgi:hypothetical protein
VRNWAVSFTLKKDIVSRACQVRKVPNSDMATFADAWRIPRRSVDCG